MESRSEGIDGGFNLNISNAIWAQREYNWSTEYLDTLKTNYAAGVYLVDFAYDPEQGREQINYWIMGETDNRISNLFAPGSINDTTRLVIVNTAYFDAEWSSKFDPDDTHDDTFYMLDGTECTAPLMNHEMNFLYSEGDGWQAVQLYYEGLQTSMVIILPETDRFDEIENALDNTFVTQVIDDFESFTVDLTMPKFEDEYTLPLKDTLIELGMVNAYSMKWADFSGMNGQRDLFISESVHKAFIRINEEKTVAAAATGHIAVQDDAGLSPNYRVFHADHPFIYLIRDDLTGTILFIGRMMNPAG
jgi:serpin B